MTWEGIPDNGTLDPLGLDPREPLHPLNSVFVGVQGSWKLFRVWGF